MRFHRPLIVALCLLSSSAASASAQSPLRWKLAPGDKLSVSVEQATTTDVAFSGKRAVTQIDLAIELTWNVQSAENNEYKIEQSVDQLQMKLTPEKGQAIAYNSREQKKLTGAAKDLEAALKPLIGAKVEITMTGRGEISAAKPVNEAAEALLAGTEAGENPAASRAAIQQLLKQSLIVLPEAEVAAGTTWESSTNLSSAIGEFKQATEYSLAEPFDQDGRQLAKITSTTKLEPAAPATVAAPAKSKAASKPAAVPRVKLHEQTGTILFDGDAGRVVEAESTQKLETERPFRETTIVVKLESKQRTTLKPAAN